MQQYQRSFYTLYIEMVSTQFGFLFWVRFLAMLVLTMIGVYVYYYVLSEATKNANHYTREIVFLMGFLVLVFVSYF